MDWNTLRKNSIYRLPKKPRKHKKTKFFKEYKFKPSSVIINPPEWEDNEPDHRRPPWED